MARKLITGNEAVALGALAAGVKVVSGYPGTPSTGALASLLADKPDGVYVEWSTNEKVAFEIATGASWAGQRALCTMKMSGLNVAADSLLAVAYSGCEGALVVYVADDPGVSAGCVEQDSRQYAEMANLPVLEPATVAEAYELTQAAFELSEAVKTPVFVRLVTALANSYAPVEVMDVFPVPEREARLIRDIDRFTKAGALICMNQHRDVIARLEKAGKWARERRLNSLSLARSSGGLGVIASGIAGAYLEEAIELLEPLGLKREHISIAQIAMTNPPPLEEARILLGWCNDLLVLEELEALIEKEIYIEALRSKFGGRIFGKLGGASSPGQNTRIFDRIGEYGLYQVASGLAKALGIELPEEFLHGERSAEGLAAARPITTCAGCPHRGTYMAINAAIKKHKLKPDQVMVTGDIGCTILGMNPPFNTVWTEVSMGASLSLAQGYVRAGVQTPVIATIGDSTFFHGGLPGLINAIQHQANLTLVIMDNLWTAMTGMQVNPGTPVAFQDQSSQVVDIARLIPALGVEQFYIVDPYDLPATTTALSEAMGLPGVKVVLARRECAIQSVRRGKVDETLRVIDEKCNLCKLCILLTGCSALDILDGRLVVDEAQCVACGVCVEACARGALELEAA